ncbi:Multifunctional pyrimidine synthesis protein CAD, partial [Ascosphaera pollenicola]
FHPEAKGGPLDSSYLFDIYVDSVSKYKTMMDEVTVGREKLPSLLLSDLLGRERVGVAKETWVQGGDGSGNRSGSGTGSAGDIAGKSGKKNVASA